MRTTFKQNAGIGRELRPLQLSNAGTADDRLESIDLGIQQCYDDYVTIRPTKHSCSI